MKRSLLAGLVVLGLVAAACGGDSGSDGHAGDQGGHDQGSAEGSVMGEVADASEADQTIKVVMLDELAYDPASLVVQEGETVTFEVVNEGQATHEFVLGDKAYQDMHEEEMSGGGHGQMSENALTLGAGESGSLTWRFTQSGEVLYGCHEPGHYEGGMVGTITVE
jgi:uncharacterized cupredoxin-like copper-binding protein